MTQLLRTIKKLTTVVSGAVSATALAAGGAAMANTPWDGGISLLPAKSPTAQEVHIFHNWVLMPVMVGISLFVLGLLIWVMLRYNAKANPTPKKFSHNMLVEILWTGIPIIILLFISLFSFDLLYKEDVIPDGKQVVTTADGQQSVFAFSNNFSERRMLKRSDHVEVFLADASGERKLSYRDDFTLEGLGDPEIQVELKETPAAGQNVVIRGGRTKVGPGKILGLFGEDRSGIALSPTVTLKVNGYQWGWTYAYPDYGDFEVTSNMLAEDQTTSELYRFAVDNPIYLPVGESIRVVTTARDVIHSWAMPNFAIKVDAVPGRLNETWFQAIEEGTYYGQCSEICGVKHSFMPIEIRIVSREAFLEWVDEQRELNGMEPMSSALAEAPEVIEKAIAGFAPAGADAVVESTMTASDVTEEEVANVADGTAIGVIVDDAVQSAGDVAENAQDAAQTAVDDVTRRVAAVAGEVVELPENLQRCEDDLNDLVRETKIVFRISSAEIASESFGVLDEISRVAKACEGARIEVEGHTDSTGSEETNRVLSEARAQSVVEYLAADGVARSALRAKGYGPSRPVATNGTRVGRAQNRRIEFSVSMPDAATAE